MEDFPKAILEPQGPENGLRGPREPPKCTELTPFLRMLLWVTVRPEWAKREMETFIVRVLGPDIVNPLIFTRSPILSRNYCLHVLFFNI